MNVEQSYKPTGININFKVRPGKFFHSLIFFTILFPFIPAIIPSADTQPTFLLFFFCSFFYTLINTEFQKNYYNLSYAKIYFLFFLLVLILVSVILGQMVIGRPLIFSRVISFLQFASAVFFAYNTRYFIQDERLKKTFIIFAVFSIIFFLTRGMVERILIPSRADSFALLQKTGRGARTLSPEPSFFALHMLNLYIIYVLVSTKEFRRKHGAIVFWVTSFCLLISLSGYGFVIFVILLMFRYTKTALLMGVVLLSASGLILEYLQSFPNFRAFQLLANVLANDPSILMKDPSFSSRFGSFFTYIENIRDNFLIGDGFTLLQGGGFISIVSSLGLLAAMFFLVVIYQILKLNEGSGKVKFLLIFWFLINLFSGPIGIAPLGIIIGLIIRRNYVSRHLQLVPNENF